MKLRSLFLTSMIGFGLFAAVDRSDAQEIQVLQQPEEVSFPNGYDVLEAGTWKVIKQVNGPTVANVQAYVDIDGARYLMSDWSLQQLQQNKAYNWMRARVPAAPAPMSRPQAEGVVVFQQPVEMTFERGFEVLDLNGLLVESYAGKRTAVISAQWKELDSFGRQRFITDWSWERYRKEGIPPNFVVEIPAPYKMSKREKARELRDKGRFVEAVPLARQAVAEAKTEEEKVDALGELQLLLFRLGRWEEAEGPTRELITRQPERLPSEEDTGIERRSVELGWILENLGRREEALTWYDRGAKRFDSIWFYDSKRAREALESAFLRYGDFSRLDQFLAAHPEEKFEAVDLVGAPSEFDSESLKILRRAYAYKKAGKVEEAIREFSAYCAVNDAQTLNGSEYFKALSFFRSQGDTTRLERFLRHYVTLFEGQRYLLGKLPDWADLMKDQGLENEAETLLARIESHSQFASYAPLAFPRAWERLGNAQEARESYERAVPCLEKLENPEEGGYFEHLDDLENYFGEMTEAYLGAGMADKAVAFLKRRYGNLEAIDPAVPRVVHESVRKAALLSSDEALRNTFSKRAIQEDRDRMERVITKYPENRRLAAFAEFRPLALPFSSGNANLAADAVLQFKGIVLDSLAREQLRLHDAKLTKSQRDKVKELERLRSALIQQELSGTPGDLLRSLEESIERLEAEIFGRASAARSAIDLDDITARRVGGFLATGDALVEFVLYRHLTGFRSFEDRYAAIVLRSGRSPAYVALGEADAMDDLIREHRRLLEEEVPHVAGEGAPKDERARVEERFAAASRQLYDRIWAPLEDHFKGVNRLYLSMDGGLHFCPVASLADERGRFAVEKWKIRHVGSGRDLLSNQDAPEEKSKLAWLMGNPDFAGNPVGASRNVGEFSDSLRGSIRTALQADRVSQRRVPIQVPLAPLEGTKKEVTDLEKIFLEAGYRVQVYSEGKATEETLRFSEAPSIVHFATHGVFLPVFEIADDSGDSVQNPMARSFITLTGADRTINAWNRGDVPDPNSDGLLMAAEAAALNLHGTELVVLSACETGLGESRRGEGVFGLKRALRQAGAQNVLTTLWNIADVETVELITDFYTRVIGGSDPGDALADAQAAMLRRYADESGTGVAAYFAGPFVVDVSGRR